MILCHWHISRLVYTARCGILSMNILYFQTSMPPAMAFNLGSLGFLTPFNFDNFKESVTYVIEGR